MRRRQKLEPPPSLNGTTESEHGNDPLPSLPRQNTTRNDSTSDRRSKPTRTKGRRKRGGSSSSSTIGGLTQREVLLVLATAILVYGGCCRRSGRLEKDGYALFLSERGGGGRAFGDGVGKTAWGSGGGGGGHPRDPAYLRSLPTPSGGGGDPRVRRVGGGKHHHRSGRNNLQQKLDFTPVPEAAKKTFYYDNQKISMPVIRALRSRGWRKVDEIEDAQMIYTYKQMEEIGEDLQRWQRFNLIPNAYLWNDKWSFVKRYKEWEEEQKQNDDGGKNEASSGDGGDDGKDSAGEEKDAPDRYSSVFVPESYMLTGEGNLGERLAFARRLEGGGKGDDEGGGETPKTKRTGADYPWVLKEGDVNQGRGITVLAPNSPELLDVPRRFQRLQEERDLSKEEKDAERNSGSSDEEDEASDVIVQKYVCNEMTWNKRKFDVRVFWLVASIDPLVVLYHDGYVRIGNADYSETDFSDTKKHLTTHTKLGAEGKATFGEFEKALEVLATPEKGRTTTTTPIEHVRNQMKAALGEMIERFREVSFVPNAGELPTDNSYSFYCADFILDNDLDVWFLEPQFGCGLDEDYYFRLEMHASLFNGMADILEEIWTKEQQQQQQQRAHETPGEPSSVSPPPPLLPLQHQGNWEVIYAGAPSAAAADDDDNGGATTAAAGKAFRYHGYDRSRDKVGCDAAMPGSTE